ncbi:hypothetical protein VSS95_29595, partial [Pseudomonas syringae pv. tagetis]
FGGVGWCFGCGWRVGWRVVCWGVGEAAEVFSFGVGGVAVGCGLLSAGLGLGAVYVFVLVGLHAFVDFKLCLLGYSFILGTLKD